MDTLHRGSRCRSYDIWFRDLPSKHNYTRKATASEKKRFEAAFARSHKMDKIDAALSPNNATAKLINSIEA